LRLPTETRASYILFPCWNTCTRYYCRLPRRCKCTDDFSRQLKTNSSLDSPPSVDSTGDFLTLVPLRNYANTSPTPTARAVSPTPSSTSAAISTVFSVTSTTSVTSLSPAKGSRLDSLFNIRRGYHIPLVSLTERKDGAEHDAPPAPTPVSLGPADWRSWLGGLVGSGSVTGDQIDAICRWRWS
jgi:hypothetical protein